ncbi:MAG: LptA/OstA family protein [Verrucomicrobiota bacterium]
MRELPRTEQAGGYVDASERITTPPKPAPKPVIASTSTSGKKAGPSNPSSTAVSPPKPKTSSSAADLPESVHRGLEFVKANAPTSTDELIEEVSKPLRISPPEIEDLLLPSDMESFGAEEMADHEEKIESMLPGFVPVHYQKPEVEMEYVQAAPLMRATSNLFDFAIKHFVRVPVSASGDGTEPVKAPSGTTVAENPPSTDTPPPGEPEVSSDTEPASQKNAPPPSFDESADPLNGFTITSLHQTDFNLEDSEMVFSGDVFCESPDFQMSCDEFIVHLRKDMKGMAYGEAKGNVVITTVKDGKATGHTGYARHAIYRPDQDNIMLSGWPRIRYGGKEQVAASSSTQMILSTDGQVKTLGRSKTRFVGNP